MATSKNKETQQNAQENAQQNASDFYTNAPKYWADSLNTWSKWMNNNSGAPGMDAQSWFKPFSSYMDWTKQSTAANQAQYGYASFFQNFNDKMAQTNNLYLNAFNTWLKGMDFITRETLQATQKVANGEQADTARLYETIHDATSNIMSASLETLKGTPFEGIQKLQNSVMNAIDSMPEEQKMAKEYFERIFVINAKIANLSSVMVSEAAQAVNAMKEKGELPKNELNNMFNAYNETVKSTMETLKIPGEVNSCYKNMMEDSSAWTRANIDLLNAWTAMSMKIVQAAAKSTTDAIKTSDDAIRQGKIKSPEDMYKVWDDTTKKATESLVKHAQVSENVRNVMAGYDAWMKSADKLSKSAMTPPSQNHDTSKEPEEAGAASPGL